MEMVSPREAVQILQAHGTYVCEEEAKIILEFMVKLAGITLSQFQKNEDCRPIHPGEH